MDRLRTVSSVIADSEHYAEGPDPAADFKPAAPHPLGGSGGSGGFADPVTGEPPAGA